MPMFFGKISKKMELVMEAKTSCGRLAEDLRRTCGCFLGQWNAFGNLTNTCICFCAAESGGTPTWQQNSGKSSQVNTPASEGTRQ